MTYCDIMILNLIEVKFLGGEAREFGGEASPLSPPLDETLVTDANWAHEFKNLPFSASLDLGCYTFPKGGDSVLSIFSWEPLQAKLEDN